MDDSDYLKNIGVGKKVLVIDDDKYARSISKKVLGEYGYEVSAVEDGIEGIKVMVDFQPDLVLLDLMMPVISGFDVLKKMKDIKELKDIPVLMVSAHSEIDQVKIALSLGAIEYIVKPIKPMVLVERVVRALQGDLLTSSKEERIVKPLDGKTHLLLLSWNISFQEEIRSGLPQEYEIKVVSTIDEIPEYYESSFSEFILADEGSLEIPSASRLSSTIKAIDSSGLIKPYLYFWSDIDQETIDEYIKQGLESCIKRPEKPEELVSLFNETFEVNLVEVISADGDVTILRRKPVDTAAAGRETTKLVKELSRSGKKKFIIDLSVLDEIKLEELQYLAKFSNFKTKLGISVSFVMSSKRVQKSFLDFVETVNVSIFASVESALKAIS